MPGGLDNTPEEGGEYSACHRSDLISVQEVLKNKDSGSGGGGDPFLG